MSSLEILATIFAIIVLVKLIFLSLSARLWMKTVGAMLNYPLATTLIYLVLAGIVGYYVLSNIAIIQIAAVMLFTSLLGGIGLAPYSRVMLRLGEEILNEGVSKAWLSMLIWTLVAIWVLYTVFVKSVS